MALCPTECAQNLPSIAGAGCVEITRPAGFDRVIWKRCDYVFEDITDLGEWEGAIEEDKIHASGRVLGSKPKGSPSKRKIYSCLPEKTVMYTRQWQWTDPNADNTDFSEYTFYQFVDLNQGLLHIAFLTCDSLLYGFFEDYSFDVDDTRSNTSDEEAVMDCAVEVKSRLIAKPQLIPGLSAVLL